MLFVSRSFLWCLWKSAFCSISCAKGPKGSKQCLWWEDKISTQHKHILSTKCLVLKVLFSCGRGYNNDDTLKTKSLLPFHMYISFEIVLENVRHFNLQHLHVEDMSLIDKQRWGWTGSWLILARFWFVNWISWHVNKPFVNGYISLTHYLFHKTSTSWYAYLTKQHLLQQASNSTITCLYKKPCLTNPFHCIIGDLLSVQCVQYCTMCSILSSSGRVPLCLYSS